MDDMRMLQPQHGQSICQCDPHGSLLWLFLRSQGAHLHLILHQGDHNVITLRRSSTLQQTWKSFSKSAALLPRFSCNAVCPLDVAHLFEALQLAWVEPVAASALAAFYDCCFETVVI